MRSRRSMATYGAVSACLVLALAACGSDGGGSGLVGMTRVIADSGADNQLMMTGAHIVATPLLTPDSGVSYSDFTPLATVYTEYVYFFVRPDSEIQSIADLADKLKEDPS